MYDFHYNVMTPRYGSNLNLLFTNTDSLMYEMFIDAYQDMKQFQDYFDTSDYDPNHPLQCQEQENARNHERREFR